MSRLRIGHAGTGGWTHGVWPDLRCSDDFAISGEQVPSHERTILWAGGLGDGDFDPNPRTWLDAGWKTFMAALPELPPYSLIRPHWAHVVSDAMSARRLHTEASAMSVGLALSPASMLSPGMMADADEHLDRFFELAGEAALAVVLEDLSTQHLTPCPAGQGDLDGRRLGRLLDRHVPEAAPVIVLAEDEHAAKAWLGW